MTYVILHTNLGQKVKNTSSYAKKHEESKKIRPQIWKWPEVAVLGFFLQKMAEFKKNQKMLVIAWIDHLMGTFRCWDQIQYFYLKIFKNSVIFSHFFKIWLNFWKLLKSNTKYLKWPPSRYFWVLMLNLMLLFENLRKISHFSRFFKQNLAKVWILSYVIEMTN